MKPKLLTFFSICSLIVLQSVSVLAFPLSSTRNRLGADLRIRIETLPRVYSLAVGLQKFAPNSKMPVGGVKFAVADAKALSEEFTTRNHLRDSSSVPPKSTADASEYKYELLDSDVTRENIARAFETIAAKIRSEDIFVFSFAGNGAHMGTGFALLTYEATDWSDPKNVMHTSELQALFRKIRAKNKIIFLDSCDSSEGFDAAGSAFIESNAELRSAINHNILFLGTDTVTYEHPTIGHGVLTKVVLDGIRGDADIDGSGIVTSRELEAYFSYGAIKLASDLKLANEVSPRTIRVGGNFNVAYTNKKQEEYAASRKAEAEKKLKTNPDTSTGEPVRAKVYGETPITDASKPRDGDDYALLFANEYNDDPNWDRLKNPLNDANDIAKELRERYGFKEVVIKENLTQKEIRDTLVEYQRRQFKRPDDQLLVFFAGHGVTQKISDIASNSYYVGRSSPPFTDEDAGKFLPLDSILQMVAGFKVSHVFTVFDTCYAGQIWKPAVATYTRRASVSTPGLDDSYAISDSRLLGRGIGKSDFALAFLERRSLDDRLIFAKRTMNNQSRIVLTSGNRPVLDAYKKADGALSRNSPFADRFLEALREGGRPRNYGVLTANEIYSAVLGLPVQPMVGQMGGTDGDFVFVPSVGKTPASSH